jgi:hypothetical protein
VVLSVGFQYGMVDCAGGVLSDKTFACPIHIVSCNCMSE